MGRRQEAQRGIREVLHLIGESYRRKEDRALVAGRGRYLDDLVRPGMVFLGVVRSPHSSARLKAIRTESAAALPGVLAAFAAEDLPEIERPIPPYFTRPKFRAFEQPVLAKGVVRYVGEPVAVVVAEDPTRLADAIEAMEVEYEEIPAVASVRAAMENRHRVFEHWPDNVAYVSRGAVGNVDAAMADADIVVTEKFRHGRSAGMPMEPRGVLAYVEDTSGMLVVASSTQVTYHVREAIAAVLGYAQERIRVLAPDVGGAFGAKAQIYNEEILVPAVALRLERPVKWIESRNEHFIATCHDREQEHEIRVGFKRDGRIVAIDDKFWADFGAYPVQDDGVTLNTINHLCSPYKVAHYCGECVNVVTNKMYSAAYRGAGRPEAAFVMDRVLDIAARRLDLDPAELRRRNLVQPSDGPYSPGLTYKDGVPIVYDPGDYPAAFKKLLDLIGYEDARALQKRQNGAVRRVGIGLSLYLHGSALGPYEGANVRVDPNGKVYVYVGCSSQGQGHATTLAQICAEELGVPFEDVLVVGADTQVLPYGVGAMASRIAANSGPAIARAAREVRRKIEFVGASMFEAAPEDIRIKDGRIHVVGMPDRSLKLAEVARVAVKAKPLRTDPGLNACTYFSPKTVTWAFGGQAAVIEVDVETCEVTIVKYAAVHDCGRAINPMIVDGQLHGAIAQGLGGAMMEELVYDEAGQLQTGSFMDYTMPKADHFPAFITAHLDHPSIINDLGVKGVGESGTISPGAVIANAVEDALASFGVVVREVPVTPRRIFELMRQAAERR
jgi:aerobic carbon-monoxide dehydrogenase large subunit